MAQFKQLKEQIVKDQDAIRAKLQRRREELEADLRELQIQEEAFRSAVNGTAEVTAPTPAKGGYRKFGRTFREALAMVTKNGKAPMTKAELMREMPKVYPGKLSMANLNARLYQKDIISSGERSERRFAAAIAQAA